MPDLFASPLLKGFILKPILNGLLALGLGLLSVAANAFSDLPSESKYTPRPGFHVVFNGGMTRGGDTVFTAKYNDGSTVDVSAGGVMQFGMGGLYQFKAMPLALRVTANVQNDWALSAGGEEAIFSRIPMEAMVYYTGIKRCRFGGGMRYVNAPKMALTVGGTTTQIRFSNTTGAVVEAGYQLSQAFWVNLRYVSEKYQAPKYFLWDSTGIWLVSTPKQYNGSHVGLNFSYEF